VWYSYLNHAEQRISVGKSGQWFNKKLFVCLNVREPHELHCIDMHMRTALHHKLEEPVPP
jgi:hypothetical protein